MEEFFQQELKESRANRKRKNYRSKSTEVAKKRGIKRGKKVESVNTPDEGKKEKERKIIESERQKGGRGLSG